MAVVMKNTNLEHEDVLSNQKTDDTKNCHQYGINEILYFKKQNYNSKLV